MTRSASQNAGTIRSERAAQVAPGPRGGAPVETGGDERPVEQEAREDEEQRDAGVEAGRERAERFVRAKPVPSPTCSRTTLSAASARTPSSSGKRGLPGGGATFGAGALTVAELTAARHGSGRGEASRA